MTRKRQSSSASYISSSQSSSPSPSGNASSSPATSFTESPILKSSGILPNLEQQLHTDGAPKRPMNVFLVYSRWRRESGNLDEDFSGIPRSEWSTHLGKEWKGLPASERAKWQELYDQLRKKFDELFPDYKYTRTSRRSSTGSTSAGSRPKKVKSSTSAAKTERDVHDSYSPPKKNWNLSNVTRNSARSSGRRRRVSAPEYREGSPEREEEESPLTGEDSDDDEYGIMEFSDEQTSPFKEHQPEQSGSSFPATTGLGLYGMGMEVDQAAASSSTQASTFQEHADSPASSVDNQSQASTRSVTPVMANYEAAPVPNLALENFRVHSSQFSPQYSLDDSSFNQTFASWERTRAFGSSAQPHSPAHFNHINIGSYHHQAVGVAPDENQRTYDFGY